MLNAINKVWLLVTFLLASLVAYRVVNQNKKIRTAHFLAILLGFMVFAVSEVFELYFIIRGVASPLSDLFLTIIGFCFVFGFLGGLRE